MIVEEIMGVLSEYGVDSRESGKSLAVQYCPECGRKKYKVLFRLNNDDDEPLLGRCMSGSCQQGYSTVSYMLKLGVPYSEVMAAHGKDAEKEVEKLTVTKEIREEHIEVDNKPVGIDISEFFDIELLPTHPASLYAISRGYNTQVRNAIKIDINSCAVVFISYIGNTPVGYQKRFVVNTGVKTDTAKGFDASCNAIRFKNSGDIVIAEGPFTALSAWHWGFDSFATFGSNISERQLELITDYARHTGKRILVAMENDDAGRKFYEKIYNHFDWIGIMVQAILPETGDDLNDSWKSGKKYTIEKVIINSAIVDVSTLW